VVPDSDEFVNSNPIPVDPQGKAHISEGSTYSYACHTVSDDDVNIILDIKHSFDKPIPQVREQLQNINEGCPHIQTWSSITLI